MSHRAGRAPETAFVWMAAFIIKNGIVPNDDQMDRMLNAAFKFCAKAEKNGGRP